MYTEKVRKRMRINSKHTATHCNTLQHTATHCNTLHHTTTHCNTLQHTDNEFYKRASTHVCHKSRIKCEKKNSSCVQRAFGLAFFYFLFSLVTHMVNHKNCIKCEKQAIKCQKRYIICQKSPKRALLKSTKRSLLVSQ